MIKMNELDSNKPEQKKRYIDRLPFWVVLLALVFPPAWIFLMAVAVISYPKMVAIILGSTALVTGGLILAGSEMKKADERREEQKALKEEKQARQKEQSLLDCKSKYSEAASVPESDGKCLSLLTASEKEEAKAIELARQKSESNAEWACRRAVKNSLRTTDGYRIPLGSVKTAPRLGYEGQFITKFPFTVKNSFGVRMKHGVECVATGQGKIIEINQLF